MISLSVFPPLQAAINYVSFEWIIKNLPAETWRLQDTVTITVNIKSALLFLGNATVRMRKVWENFAASYMRVTMSVCRPREQEEKKFWALQPDTSN